MMMSIQEFEAEVSQLKQKISEIGLMLPGSISEQWNVCGMKGCKCKDKKNPQKHGPYYQLSYSLSSGSSTMFVKKENLSDTRQFILNYKMFKKLNVELVTASVKLVRAKNKKKPLA
jgi:hypothetical protein